MKKLLLLVIGCVLASPALAGAAGSNWSDAQMTVFTAGCTMSILIPAKRDYAAAAAKVGNTNPTPFPEAQFRASVEPMCRCLGGRLAEASPTGTPSEAQMRSVLHEAFTGGRCKPTGLLGQMLDAPRRRVAKY